MEIVFLKLLIKRKYILGLILLLSFALPANAVTVTWTGNGSDSLTSNPDNWTNSIPPQDGDDVVLDGSSTKDCIWDLDIVVSSLTASIGYTGSISSTSDIKTTGNLNISGGVLTLTTSNTYVGFSTPSATTDSAGKLNGNSATLYATVDPNGLDTTVYFECGTDSSYGNNTSTQSIGNGMTNIPVSADITGFLPDTSYQCRVVVTNAYGIVYGYDIYFTTPPITLTITSPLDEEVINRPNVLVQGTITNVTGNETGITVNGEVAIVYNGEFIANHVPLNDGNNLITVQAIDIVGNSAVTDITVSATTSSSHIILSSNLKSSISPLTVYFSVSSSIPNTATNYQMDFNGDAVIDYDSAIFQDVSFEYINPGVYFATLSVTDVQSITYFDTVAIVILSETELDSLLTDKWNSMTSSLSAEDTAAALAFISTDSVNLYQQIFNALTGQLPSIVASQSTFTLITVADNLAEYDLEAIDGGTIYSFEVIFTKDTDGLWRIKEF